MIEWFIERTVVYVMTAVSVLVVFAITAKLDQIFRFLGH